MTRSCSTAGTHLSQALGAVLERLECGESVSTEWLRRRWPDRWEEIRDAVSLEGGLRPDEPAPELVGPYRLEAWLGRGGMGTVYRARRADGSDPAPVAVKILHPQVAARPGFAERFRREAELGLQVRNVHVVRTLAHGETDCAGARAPYLVMEYVEGRTLRGLMDEVGTPSESLCLHVAAAVARGLAAIHGAGAVHRDVKPENILITPDEFVMLMDLGVAAVPEAASSADEDRAFFGTPRYAAPEQIDKAGRVDGRADLYALGLVLFELAAGSRPRAAGAPEPPSARRPGLTPFFDALVLRLCARDPAERFQSARECMSVLQTGRVAPDPGRLWEGASLRRPRLQGRDAELSALEQRLLGAAHGDGAAVLLMGDAGIGKSRIADEFLERFERRLDDLRVVRGAFHPTRGAAMGGIAGAYARHLAEHPDPRGSVAAPGLRRLLLGSSGPGAAAPDGDDGARTFLFAETTRELAAERTTVVVIEDLHHADQADHALFVALARGVRRRRALLVGVARPGPEVERAAKEAARAGAVVLEVGPLPDDVLGRVVDDALGTTLLVGRVGPVLARRAGGNPFLALEMLHALEASGALRRGVDGEWRLTRAVEDAPVPGTIREAVRGRLAGLSEATVELLFVAACAGREFDALHVGRALRRDGPSTVEELAAVARTTALIRRAGPGFAFEQELVRESLLAVQDGAALASRLRRLGEAIEERAAERTDGALSDDERVAVAGHFIDADDPLRARPHVLSALRRLVEKHESSVAARLAERALAAAGVLVGTERIDALLLLSDCCERLGRTDDRDRALEHAGALADSADVLRRLRCAVRRARLARARGRAEEGIEILARTAVDDSVPARDRVEFGRVRAEMSTALARTDDAAAEYRRAIDVASAAGEVEMVAEMRADLGRHFAYRGRYAEADAETGLAEELGRAVGSTRALGVASLARGIIAASDGSEDRGAASFARAGALAVAVGDRRLAAGADLWLGIALSWARPDEALAALRRAEAHFVELGDARGTAGARSQIVFVLAEEQRCAEALAAAERLVRSTRDPGTRRSHLAALQLLALILGALGDAAGTRSCLDEMRGQVEESADAPERWQLAVVEVYVADAEGDEESGLRARRRAHEMSALPGNSGWRSGTALDLGLVLATRGERAEAVERLEECLSLEAPGAFTPFGTIAAAMLAKLGARSVEDVVVARAAAIERLAPMDRVVVEHLLWQTTGDLSRLARAHALVVAACRNCPPARRQAYVSANRWRRDVVEAWERFGPRDAAAAGR